MNRVLIFLFLLPWPFTWQDVKDSWWNTRGDYVPCAGLTLWLESLGLKESFTHRYMRAKTP